MLITQAIMAFLLWIVFGLFEWQRAAHLFENANKCPRNRRTFVATAWLVGSALVLLGGLFAISQVGGFLHNGMDYWAWACVAALGIFFVHGQTLAAVLLVSLSRADVAPRGVVPAAAENEVSNDD